MGGRLHLRRGLIIVAVVLVTGGCMILFGGKTALKVGDRAPDFALADQSGAVTKLSDFRGKKNVVLAFYIKAFTPG